LIETPMRKPTFRLRWIAIAYMLVAGFSWSVYSADRVDVGDGGFARPVWYGVEYNVDPRGEPAYWTNALSRANVLAPPRRSPANAFKNGGQLYGEKKVPSVVLLGDSHGSMWAHEIRRMVGKKGLGIAIWTLNGVNPFLTVPPTETSSTGGITRDEKFQYDQSRLSLLAKWKPKLVIIAVRWELWKNESPEPLIRFALENSDRVVILGPIPETKLGDQMLLPYLEGIGVSPRQGQPQYLEMKSPAKTTEIEYYIKSLCASLQRCDFIRLADFYRRGDHVLVLIGAETIYLDDDHLTHFGTTLAAKRIENILMKQFTIRDDSTVVPVVP